MSLCKTLLLVQVFLPNGKPHWHILVLSSLTLANSAWRTVPKERWELYLSLQATESTVGKEAPLVATDCPPEVKPILCAGLRGQFSDLALNGVMKLVTETQEPEEKKHWR